MVVEAAARRQKWIDGSQSLNLYIPDSDGKKLDSAYKLAWIRGLKTTYYLRSMGATHVRRAPLTIAVLILMLSSQIMRKLNNV